MLSAMSATGQFWSGLYIGTAIGVLVIALIERKRKR